MQRSPKSLNDWINYLAEEEFPVLSETMNRIGNLDDNVNDFPSELASIILQDPNMTARVLKMANSAYYNIGSHTICTVSRAVLFLGYDAICSIYLSSGVFQQLLKKDPSDRLLRGISESFQAAVQSQQISEARHEQNSEELFICSMLFHMGEIAFWTFGGATAKKINALMLEQGYSQTEAQEEVLGFKLSDLTYGLAERWGMSKVLLNALLHKDTPDSDSRNIILSHRLLNVSSNGWKNHSTKKVINQLAEYTKLSLDDIRKIIVDSAEITIDVLKGHGFTDLISKLNFPPGTTVDLSAYQPKRNALKVKKEKKVLKAPNLVIIDNILNELKLLEQSENKLDVNFVLQLVLEGIHRGVGMDRSLVALMDNSSGKLNGKYAVQDGNSSLVTDFMFTLESTPLFKSVIRDKMIIWSKKSVHGPMAGELLAKFKVMLGSNDFLAGPLMIRGKAIGLYYADRYFSNQSLTLNDLETFQVVVNRANEILHSFGN